MPTYEYVCKSCGEHTDAVQSFTDEALTVCPHCRGALRKVFGNIGISFKGSGFYKNDSRSGAASSTKAGDSTSTSSENGASSSDGAAAPSSTTTKESGSGDKSSSTPADSGASNGKRKGPATGPGGPSKSTAST